MYAQNPRGASLPRNYSGNAFRYPPIHTDALPNDSMSVEEERRETAVNEQTTVSSEAKEPTCSDQDERCGERSGLHLPLPFLARRGLGSEELLLLGLLLLLGGGEGQSDVMMCLLILLFCA